MLWWDYPAIRSAAAAGAISDGGRDQRVNGDSRSTETGKHGESEDEAAHGDDLSDFGEMAARRVRQDVTLSRFLQTVNGIRRTASRA